MSPTSRIDALTALIESAVAVVGEFELDIVLQRLVREAMISTRAKYAAIGVVGDHGVLSDFIFEGLSDEEAARIGEPPKGRGVLGTVIRENRTIRLASIGEHPDAHGFPAHHPPMETFLGVPISAGAEPFGNLYLCDKAGGFTDGDVVRVEALSRIAGVAVQTARLQERLRRVAVVEDRERIARDLHDSVIQDLFAVGLGLQSLAERVDDSATASVLDQAVDRLDSAVESLRTYIFQLRESAASPNSLANVLQELVSRMGSAYPTRVTLDIETDDSLPQLIEDEIAKIVTEALSNGLRHADAGSVTVSLRVQAGTWEIRVEDDGVGFDVDNNVAGMGLHNMKTRATSVGATFSLTSSPGNGTAVVVSGRVS